MGIEARVDAGRLRGRVHGVWEGYLKYWLTVPMALLLFGVTVFPFVYNVYLSVVHYSLTDPDAIGTFAGLANFEAAFADPTTWKSVQVTALFIGGALALQTGLGFSLAVLVKNVTHRFKGLYRIVFILPMGVAPVSLAVIGRLMLNSEVGVVPYLISTYTPFAPPLFLSEPTMALVTVILADSWQWTPFMFIIFYAGLTSVPDEPIEAARVDGARDWQIYRYVILPLMKPVIVVAVLIRFIDLSRAFGLVFALTSGGPGNATRLFGIHVFQTVFTYAQMGTAGAMVLAYLVAVVVICNIYIIVLGFRGVWS